MNINDASSILYPVNGEKEIKLPVFVVGSYYLLDGDVMRYDGTRDGYMGRGPVHFFKGIPMETRVLHEEYRRDRDLLHAAVPALEWEIRDYKEKEAESNASLSSWFDRFGCD